MPKCGTVSLQKYLKERFGTEAVRVEQIWKGNIEEVKEKRNPSEWHYVIILRDNIERIWSGYHYFQMAKTMTLEQYLMYELANTKMGVSNPLKQGDYGHWLKVWESLEPIVVTLEDMMKMDGFPHANKTDRPEMTESDRVLISSYLNKNEVIING